MLRPPRVSLEEESYGRVARLTLRIERRDEADDPRQPAAKLGDRREGLEDPGSKRVRSHPAERVLDLAPAVKHEREAGDEAEQKQGHIRRARQLRYSKDVLDIHDLQGVQARLPPCQPRILGRSTGRPGSVP